MCQSCLGTVGDKGMCLQPSVCAIVFSFVIQADEQKMNCVIRRSSGEQSCF